MNPISEIFKTESELKDFRKRRANECFKECRGDCLVEGSIRLYPFCDECIKVKKRKKSTLSTL